MRTSVVVVLTAWLLLASSSFVAVSGTRAATTPPRPMGGFVDSMLWSAQPSEAQALLDLQSGALDVYAYPAEDRGGHSIGTSKSESSDDRQLWDGGQSVR